MRKILIAAATIISFTGSALASESAIIPAMPFADGEATGSLGSLGSLELRGGASFTGFQVGITGGYAKMDDYIILFPGITAEGEGGIYGLYAAFNHQVGNVVAGAEVSYLRHDSEFDDGSGVIVEDVFSAKVRAGFAMGRFHAYGAAGVSHATTNIVGEDFGVNFGGGFDVLVTDKIVVGGQYAYHHFGNFDGVGIDANLHEFTGRVAYKF